MKNRFSTLDLRATIIELQEKYQGMRVMNIYDVDSKTYLIKLAKPDLKAMILLESGIRIHSTDFEWPKNITPSSFSMKMRKHLRTRRLEKIQQLGMDRIIDIQFGSNEAAYHVILELYDRGNIVLTDHEYMILNILRPRTDQSEDVRFAVHEKYPVDSVKQPGGLIAHEDMMSILLGAKEGDNLKKTINPKLVYGPALIDHAIQLAGIPNNAKIGKEFNITEDLPKLMVALEQAENILELSNKSCKGYIIQKTEKKPAMKEGDSPEELLTYSEFHPFLFKQHENQPYVELDSFDKAVDEFFSKIGSQKLDMKTLQQERAALKKLDHIKKDHEKRLKGLKQEQDTDMNKAALIEMNLELVDRAIIIIRSAIANQIDWQEINKIVKDAQKQGDPVACAIKSLKLNINHFTIFLKHPYLDSDEEEGSDDSESVTPMKVDIDLELSAYANARKYYAMKRKAAVKEQKTVDASAKALKSAQKKTFQTLKEVQTVATINKARKTYWFEKFLWFISSENYIVIGGRDQQQNEFIVKKYMRPGDLYVHADLHGASSVIIKNPTGAPIPPKTLNEAGTMALCNSAAWDARVVTSAWWVYHHQVTKTAPSGEYLTTGSFMIRGKKNFLPPSYLIYGFGFMFKVDEDSVFRHKDERRVRTLEDDTESITESISTDTTAESQELELEDVNSSDSEDESINEDKHRTEGSKTENNPQQNLEENIDNEENLTGGVSDLKIEDNLGSTSTSSSNNLDTEDSTKQEDVTKEEEEEEEEEDALFPDTNIDLQYVQGEKLRVQVSRTTSRTTSTGSTETIEDVDAESSQTKKGGAKLSAKQRRELKRRKAREASQQGEEGDTQAVIVEEIETCDPLRDSQEEIQVTTKAQKKEKKEAVSEPPPHKRGQKAKLKKMKEKYADQDEEERQLRMDILGSAGAPKEEKKKGKKGKHGATKKQQVGQGQGQPQSGQGQGQPQSGQGSQGQRPYRKLTVDDIKEESPTAADGSTTGHKKVHVKEEDALSDEEKQTLLEEENIQIGKDMNELDTLTGLPHAEDILHFCIPMCGPYSAMINYKYRVKLTPGNTKRGKAAKTAVHSFQHDRNTTGREKDLFKSLKDVDLSRNVPGKVKVSAPNLQKSKKK